MKKLLLLVSSIWYLISAPMVHAASEFTTSFNSLYVIKNSGETAVIHKITLKNNLAHIYATDYTIATSGDELTNITASDESGTIASTTTVQNGTTSIHLTIDRPAIGKDQEKTITLNYHTTGVAEIIGDTMTVNIPRLAKANEAENYTRVVKIEGTQERSSLIFPPANKTEPLDGYTSYTFIGHQSDSLTLLFGDSVTYKLNLIYELKNKELSAADSELALPPDTAYQHILLNQIDPPPIDIRLDEAGNWLARYHLKPQEKLLIKTELYATVHPQPVLYDPSTTNLVKIGRSKYWDTSSEIVRELAEKLKSPENIYRYLVTNFTYNYGGVTTGGERLGTVGALSSPSSVLCTEFTDTFVSLSRSLGIPAREINGYGYTNNDILQPRSGGNDILHSWPEYFNSEKGKWIAIDPTWGNTTGGIDYFNKLDFSHIVFVRHGLEDSYPLPAGSYKSNSADKFVEVQIGESIPEERQSLETKDGTIYNTGNVALINKTVGYLPPYGTYKIPLTQTSSLYDKIRLLCAKLLSKFWRLRPAST
ncbi:MAG: transglutaminase domain-containing protein [bacterium]